MKDIDKYSNDSIIDAVERFKRSLISGKTRYFDVSEYEEITEYFIEEGDIKNCEIAVKQGIQIHPDAVPLQLKYARILFNKGRYDECFNYLQFAEKTDSYNPDVHLLLGSTRLIAGNEYDARIYFKKAVKYAGSSITDTLYHIGRAYVMVKKYSKAIYYFEKILGADPFHKNALSDLGFYCDKTGLYQKSIEYFNTYLDIDPFSHKVWYYVGNIYNKTNNYPKAIEAFEFSLALKEDFLPALMNIGHVLAKEENFEYAIEKYTRYLELDPGNDDVYCYIGECFQSIDDYSNAELYYRKATDINNENDSAWFGLGLIAFMQKNKQESFKYVMKAINLDKTNPEYWLTLGRINKANKNKNGASDAFKNAVRYESGNIENWIAWADLYIEFNEHNKAIRILRSGIKNNPDPALKYKLVASLFENNMEKDAMDLLKIAMKQEFIQINYLFDIYPDALKNEKLTKMVDEFRKNKRPNNFISRL